MDIQDKLIYKGSVKLKILGGKEYTFHNNGYPELFKLFSKAMSGIDISSQTPYYMNMYGYDDNTKKYFLLKNPINITARNYVDSDEGGFVRFTSMFMSTNLQNIENLNQYTPDAYLSLLEKDMNTELAFVQMKATDYSDETMYDFLSALPLNVRIAVEWTLQVRNS